MPQAIVAHDKELGLEGVSAARWLMQQMNNPEKIHVHEVQCAFS